MTATDKPSSLSCAFNQLSKDHRLALQTFDTLLHTLQGAWTVGPSHPLTATWCGYRKDFKELQLRAQTNASRLASCLQMHHQQLSALRDKELSAAARRMLLDAFYESVKNGREDARQIKHDYDYLMVKVRRFPVLLASAVSSWAVSWLRISDFCSNITTTLSSCWERITLELISPIRDALAFLARQLMGPSARMSLTSMSSGSRCVEPTPKGAPDATAVANGGCNIICDKLCSLEAYWADMFISIDRLALCLERSNRMVGSPELYGGVVNAIEVAYSPVIDALNEFARVRA